MTAVGFNNMIFPLLNEMRLFNLAGEWVRSSTLKGIYKIKECKERKEKY
jgi:hypothetical protein